MGAEVGQDVTKREPERGADCGIGWLTAPLLV
jgi:hypothetical protein